MKVVPYSVSKHRTGSSCLVAGSKPILLRGTSLLCFVSSTFQFLLASHVSVSRTGGMGLWTLLEGLLLFANALAILNEDRFLTPRGWSFQEFPGGKVKSLKGQVLGLINATQYLRVPLIILNVISIVVKLVSG